MISHEFLPTILREYDVRGVIGETLFADDARALGRAFAHTGNPQRRHRSVCRA